MKSILKVKEYVIKKALKSVTKEVYTTEEGEISSYTNKAFGVNLVVSLSEKNRDKKEKSKKRDFSFSTIGNKLQLLFSFNFPLAKIKKIFNRL